MATKNELNEYESLKQALQQQRNEIELQGLDFQEYYSNNPDLRKKFKRLKKLKTKIQQTKQTSSSNPNKSLTSINRNSNRRKRRYSAINSTEINTTNNTKSNKIPRKKFRLNEYKPKIGFSPILSLNNNNNNRLGFTFNNKENTNNIPLQSNININNKKTNKNDIIFTKPKPPKPRKRRQTMSCIGIMSNNNNKSKRFLSNRVSTLKSKMQKKQESESQNNDHNNDEFDEKDIEMSNNNNDEYIPPSESENTPIIPNNTTTKKTIRKKSVRSKPSKKTMSKKSKRKTKRETNFLKMDLKHNSYRRKKRGNKNSGKPKFDRFGNQKKTASFYEWKERQRKNTIEKNNLDLTNMEKLNRQVYTDSDDENNNQIEINNHNHNKNIINPYFDKLSLLNSNSNNSTSDTSLDELLMDVLQTEYGYNKYRTGQMEAIKKILNNESVLLLMSTGFGKSICYQIPTILFKNNNVRPLTLVISPLISLMQDQCNNLPKCLVGAVWNSSSKDKKEIYQLRQDIVNGNIDILFIAPEKLDSNNFRLFLRDGIGINRLKFVCIDEAHCISEWSHNFRPSYLKLKRVLMDYLNIECILACTATATIITQKSITKNLNICMDMENGRNNIIKNLQSRNNLHLSVSHIGKHVDKKSKLLGLLCSERFNKLNSLIIYANTRDETDKIARYLSLTMKREYGSIIESYHAGKKQIDRKDIQDRFMNNKINIIIATIAFGMGINKSDIRGVIHYSMPKTMENYVQEIGRAGRDGLNSECHCFYDLGDLDIQKSRIYKNGLDLIQIKYILFDIFSKKKIKNMDKINDKLKLNQFYEVNDIICISDNKETERRYDVRSVVLNTIFTYLDVYKSQYIEQKPQHYNKIRIGFINNKFKSNIENESEIIKFIINCYKPRNGEYIVHLNKLYNDIRHIECEDENGNIILINPKWFNTYKIYQHLRDLEYQRKITLDSDNKCFVLKIKKKFDSNNFNELIELINDVYKYISNHEKIELEKTNTMAQALKIIANGNNEINLHELVDKYFKCETHDEFLEFVEGYLPDYDHIRTQPVSKNNDIYKQVKQSIIDFMKDNIEMKRERSIAQIFHGFGSPKYTYKIWKSNPFWKKYINFPFLQIIQIAKEINKEKENRKNNIKNNDNNKNNNNSDSDNDSYSDTD